MTLPEKVLIANRGEIAMRILRAAQALGIRTVAVRSQDDVGALHARRCDEVVVLDGVGPAAYLDANAIVTAAVSTAARALHPGYGLLSESAELARACDAAGVTFVGPSAAVLDVFGDKSQARALARREEVPVLPGTADATSLADMTEFAAEQFARDPGAAVMIKALSGGGGRGMRVVTALGDLPAAFEVCRNEAVSSFGRGELYVERVLRGARHIEVQVIGDGTGAVSHLWDRDCSVQRRHQKLVEIAPSRLLPADARTKMLASAVRLGAAVELQGVATVEFLALPNGEYFFLEVNPRLQVEHTVTEQVTGIDLVAAQLRLPGGATLAELGLSQADVAEPVGCAIQVRVNAEMTTPDGAVVPSTGTVSEFVPAAGAGVRVESGAFAGMAVNPLFDSMLAKVIVHDRSGFDGARRLARLAVAETRIGGVATNLDLQAAILKTDTFAAGECDTTWFDRNVRDLVVRAAAIHDARPAAEPTQAPEAKGAGADAFADDPRAVRIGMGGVVVAVEVGPGQSVAAGAVLVVVEAMKMQHAIATDRPGEVVAVQVAAGDLVEPGQVLVLLEAADGPGASAAAVEVDLDQVRPDLQEVLDRRATLLDEARPEAVAKRRAKGHRTARENVDDLTDGGLDAEYGGFAVAAQRRNRSLEDLVAKTPADGIITGIGKVNGDLFPPDRATCVIAAADYTVLGGSQGSWHHKKLDRLFEVAHERKYPVVLFPEGGGGRPGDTDVPVVAALHIPTFAKLGALSGVVPTVGILNGYCFAGSAGLLGMCDVIIATEGSNVGMAGPVMIEGAGLGTFSPDDIGPVAVQRTNGVVDITVADEAEAVAVAKKYLAYFQGPLDTYEVPDQRLLRHAIPEDRKLAYDMRTVIGSLFDVDSVLELRAGFGIGMITALARLGGQTVGVIANNPHHLGGAIDVDAADKEARFLHLCDTYAIPVVSLCDTPGFMVGPESEKQAAVRHVCRLFVIGGHMTTAFVTVVLRKGYGLGAQAMAAGSFHNTSMTLAWPTAEFGAMGIEGAVKLALRNTLAAIEDPAERQATFERTVQMVYAGGSAINTASMLEIDEVIDPITTRGALEAALLAGSHPAKDRWTNTDRHTGLDTW